MPKSCETQVDRLLGDLRELLLAPHFRGQVVINRGREPHQIVTEVKLAGPDALATARKGCR